MKNCFSQSQKTTLALFGLFLLVFTLTITSPVSADSMSASSGRRTRSSPIVKERSNVIAVTRTLRRVSMFYKLDLKKDNSHSPQVVQVMDRHEDKIRSCYTRRLDAGSRLAGDLALGIRMSRSTGTITRVKRLGGSLNDRRLLRCINRELVRLPIHPPNDLQGTLVYSFGVQENTTVRAIP